MSGIDGVRQADESAAGMLQARSLSVVPGVRHGFFTRKGGVSDGVYASLNGGIGSRDTPANVAENRSRMAAALSVPADHLVTAYQVHSPEALPVEEPWPTQHRPRADALVTRRIGIAVAITTADCAPILLADATAGVIAAAHAGWRGALTGIVGAAVALMERSGAKRSRIVAAVGPLIRQANYEVGPEFVARFLAQDEANRAFFEPSPRPEHALFDLGGYVGKRLAAAGIGHVEDLGRCTYGDPGLFFSYRRSTHRGETDYGRHIAAIALAP